METGFHRSQVGFQLTSLTIQKKSNFLQFSGLSFLTLFLSIFLEFLSFSNNFSRQFSFLLFLD